MPKNAKQTGRKAASNGSKVLSGNYSKAAKSAAASALAQTPKRGR